MYGTRSYGKRSNKTACARQRPREYRDGGLLLLLSTASMREYEGKRAMIVHTRGAGPRGGNWFSVCLFDWSTVSYICTWTVPRPLNRGRGRCRGNTGCRCWMRRRKFDRQKRPEENRQSIERPADRYSNSRNVECLAWRVALVEKRGGKKNWVRKNARSFVHAFIWYSVIHR